jgi:DNA-3-methyladenine glycosylase II
MKIALALDGPLDVATTLGRFRLWGEDPANRWRDGVFHRVLRHDGRLLPYEVRASGPREAPTLTVRAPGARGAGVARALVAEVRAVFGVDFDLGAFYRFAKGEPVLAELTERLVGLRPSLTPAPLEMLVGSITAQQVNLTFALALRARIVRRWGTPVPFGGDTVYAFPEAPVLARVPLRSLRALQFSEAKAVYVREVARALATGALDAAALAAADNAAVIERLTRLRGLGRWSAEWFLARGLGRGDVCPAGDLAVRKAFDHYFGGGRPLGEAAIRARAARWGPYQTLAVHYLLAGMRLARPAAGGGS